MQKHNENCDCGGKYFYNLGEGEDGTWMFMIGTPIDDEMVVLFEKEDFASQELAETAAKAFLAGLTFYHQTHH